MWKEGRENNIIRIIHYIQSLMDKIKPVLHLLLKYKILFYSKMPHSLMLNVLNVVIPLLRQVLYSPVLLYGVIGCQFETCLVVSYTKVSAK